MFCCKRLFIRKVTVKTCRTCKIEKPLAHYNKNKRQKDGHAKVCRECDKEYNKQLYRKKHPRESTPDGYKHCSRCKELKILAEFNRRKEVNVQPHCKECNNVIYKTWREQGSGKQWERDYAKKRKDQDPLYKLRFLLRLRLLDALKRSVRGGSVSKKHSALDLIGCSIEELKQYLESKFVAHMGWHNHGTEWEIDHIVPCTWFDLRNPEEQKRCFHYTNLQPLFRTTREVEGIQYVGNRNKRNFSSYKQ